MAFPDLTSLAIFLKASESRSLSRASDHAHIAVSAVSRRISALEDYFDVQLLNRTTSGVFPTPAGEALATRIRSLLKDVENIREDLFEFAKAEKGRVRLYANPAVMSQALPSLLSAFCQTAPGITLDLRETSTDAILKALREGSADVGLVTQSSELEGLKSEIYSVDRLCVVVPENHEITSRAVRLEDILDYKIVGISNKVAYPEAMMDAIALHGLTLKLTAQVGSFESACRMIAAGFGIGVLSQGAVRIFCESMGLRLIYLDEDWAAREMCLCWVAEKLPPPCQLLVDFLSHGFDKSVNTPIF